ncbi:hypothetical protein Golob_004256, partial [Gossypium lobatum]|nr:hypothetical protein [Gossypium lobatum]
AINAEGVIGKVLAIDCRDREDCWIEYIRPNQGSGIWQNGVEILKTRERKKELGGKIRSSAKLEGVMMPQRSKEKAKIREEASNSCSLSRKCVNRFTKEKCRCFMVEPVGRKGGLTLHVIIQNHSGQHIDSLVKIKGQDQIRFTGFYGYPELNQKHKSWDLIQRVIEDLEVVDIKLDRGLFTWNNNREERRKPKEDIRDLRLLFRFEACWAKEKKLRI